MGGRRASAEGTVDTGSRDPGMNASNDEIFRKLKDVIAVWNREVSKAHDSLRTTVEDTTRKTENAQREATQAYSTFARQIQESKDCLSALVRLLAAQSGNEGLELALSEIDSLRNQVTTKEQGLVEARLQCDQLEDIVTNLQREMADVRGQRATSEQQLEAIQGKYDELAGVLGKAHAELDTARQALAEREETSAENARQTLELRATIKTLEDDVSVLRKKEGDAFDTERQLTAELASTRAELEALQAKQRADESWAADARERLKQVDEAQARAANDKKALDSQVETLRASEESLQRELEHTRAELAKSRESADASDQEAKSLHERFTALERAMDDANNTQKSLQSTLDQTTRELQESNEARRTAVDELDQARAEARGAIGERESVAVRVVELEAQLAQRGSENTSRAGEAERLRSELEEVRAQLHEKSNALDAHHEKVRDLEKSLQAAGAQVDVLKEREAAAFEERDAAKNWAEAQTSELTKTVATLKEEVRDLRAGLDHGRESEQKLRQELEEAQKKLQSVEHATEEIEALKRSLKDREEKLSKSNFRSTQLEKSVHALNVELEELRASRQKTGDVEAGLRAEVETLRQQHAEAQSAVTDLESRIADTQSRAEKTQAEATRAIDDHSVLEKRLKAEEQEKESARKQLQDALKQGKSMEEQLAARARDLEAAEERNRQLDQTLDTLRGEIQSLRERQSLEEQLRQQLAEAQEEKEWSEVEITNLRTEVDALRQANERIRSTVEKRGKKEVVGDRIRQASFDADGKKRRMGEILVGAGLLTQPQLEKVLGIQADSGRRLGAILVEEGMTDEESIAKVLASQLRLPFVRLSEDPVDVAVAKLIDGKTATRHMCIPMRAKGDKLQIAMANPLDPVALQEIRKACKREVEPVITTLSDITASIVRVYGVS